VRAPEDRREVLLRIGELALALGAAVLGYYSSGLPGPKGNRETFIWIADRGRVGSVYGRSELEAMILEVEP